MLTECIPDLFGFAPAEGHAVVAAFDGGRVTSDAGALLLSRTDYHRPQDPGRGGPIYGGRQQDATCGECQCADEPRGGRVKREQTLALEGNPVAN